MEKVDYKTAKEEFDKWAEKKKLPSRVIENHRDDVDVIVDAIQEGHLTLDENLNFVQKLQFPLEKQGLDELTYPLRITSGEIAASTRGIKGVDDLVGQMMIGYVAALTKQNKGYIRSLDPVDMSIAGAIAAFFSL